MTRLHPAFVAGQSGRDRCKDKVALVRRVRLERTIRLNCISIERLRERHLGNK
jgi:hypothetical protein